MQVLVQLGSNCRFLKSMFLYTGFCCMFMSNVEILKYNSVLFIPWLTEVNWVVRRVIIGIATFKQFKFPGGHILG